jgi:hypothetical protein
MSPAPRDRPTGTPKLTAHVEDITTGTPARQHASTPGADADAWVNFSTYLPAATRRALRARCAVLGVEMRAAVAEAITAWLDTHPAPGD